MEENKNGNTVEVEIIPIYYDYILTQNYPVNILVGGRNSGKSFFMEQFANYKMHNSKKYKLLIVEDVETNIGAGVKDGILQRAEELGLEPYISSTKQPAEITHRLTGSTTIFKGYHSQSQQKQVKSLNEVTAAWYEEGENITQEQFKALRMQLRGGEETDRQLFITMNPINPDGYIAKEFFDGEPDVVFERFEDGRPKVFEKRVRVDLDDGETVDIPCIVVVTTHRDNPYLTDSQRADIEDLKRTNPEQYEMLSLGKFVKGKGLFFPEFERHIHTIKPFPLPEHWRRFIVLDYGLDKLAAYWVALNDRGKAFVYKEIWESDLIISKAVDRIKQYTSEKIYQYLAPPDLWNRRQETGRSVADIFQEYSIILNKTDRVNAHGCISTKEWLEPYDDEQGIKTANMVIFDTCENLIRSMRNIKTSEIDPNVYADQPHEYTHSVSAMVYFFGGRPRPYKPVNKFGLNHQTHFTQKQQSKGGFVTW